MWEIVQETVHGRVRGREWGPRKGTGHCVQAPPLHPSTLPQLLCKELGHPGSHLALERGICLFMPRLPLSSALCLPKTQKRISCHKPCLQNRLGEGGCQGGTSNYTLRVPRILALAFQVTSRGPQLGCPSMRQAALRLGPTAATTQDWDTPP